MWTTVIMIVYGIMILLIGYLKDEDVRNYYALTKEYKKVKAERDALQHKLLSLSVPFSAMSLTRDGIEAAIRNSGFSSVNTSELQ